MKNKMRGKITILKIRIVHIKGIIWGCSGRKYNLIELGESHIGLGVPD